MGTTLGSVLPVAKRAIRQVRISPPSSSSARMHSIVPCLLAPSPLVVGFSDIMPWKFDHASPSERVRVLRIENADQSQRMQVVVIKKMLTKV